MIREAWDNWSTRGVPRCAGYDFITQHRCNGLIWPWQEEGGGIDEPMHRACGARYWASLEEFEQLEEQDDPPES